MTVHGINSVGGSIFCVMYDNVYIVERESAFFLLNKHQNPLSSIRLCENWEPDVEGGRVVVRFFNPENWLVFRSLHDSVMLLGLESGCFYAAMDM